jgi:tetratricopeptide (TPR) repeat protein
LTAGVLALLAFGVTLGLGIARYAERERTAGAVAPAPERGALLPVEPPAGVAGKVTPEMLRGMLDSARKSLFAGRYQEAIAAYQAVLKHDPKNVDAITHMGLIVATGGHGDSALQAFDRALSLDPNYPPAHLYRGQVLYETKQDYRGAIQAWEKFVQLIPEEENKETARRMIREARDRLANQPR